MKILLMALAPKRLIIASAVLYVLIYATETFSGVQAHEWTLHTRLSIVLAAIVFVVI